MKNYIADFLNDYNFPICSKSTLFSTFDLIGESNIVNICEQFDKENDFSVLTAQTKALAHDFNTHEYTVKLLVMIALTRSLKTRFKQSFISDDVFMDTMRDLLYKYYECKNLYGIDGITEFEWYEAFFQLKHFAFGRLQFQIDKFRLESYTKNGKTVKQGDTVLSIHIPSSNEPLTSEACETSYKKAREFFHNRLGFTPPFVCWSWLLYKKNKEFLSENSNILAFAKKFDIIEEEVYSDEGFNAFVGWRIFNIPKIDKIEELPRNTSMQRNVADYLAKGNKLGWGYGIFF